MDEGLIVPIDAESPLSSIRPLHPVLRWPVAGLDDPPRSSQSGECLAFVTGLPARPSCISRATVEPAPQIEQEDRCVVSLARANPRLELGQSTGNGPARTRSTSWSVRPGTIHRAGGQRGSRHPGRLPGGRRQVDPGAIPPGPQRLRPGEAGSSRSCLSLCGSSGGQRSSDSFALCRRQLA